MNNEKTFEKVSSDSVKDKIKKEGFTAGRNLIENETKRVSERGGFNPDDIRPIITEGVREASK